MTIEAVIAPLAGNRHTEQGMDFFCAAYALVVAVSLAYP